MHFLYIYKNRLLPVTLALQPPETGASLTSHTELEYSMLALCNSKLWKRSKDVVNQCLEFAVHLQWCNQIWQSLEEGARKHRESDAK